MSDEDRREHLIQKLQQLAQEEARSPTKKDMQNAEGYPDPVDYINEFGWWNDAKEAAGLTAHPSGTTEKHGFTRKYSRSELLERLRALNDQIDHTVRLQDMDDADGYPSATVYRQRFGSWTNALEAAGIEVDPNEYSDDELLAFLRKKAEEVLPVRRKDIAEDPDMPNPKIYYDRFGSFQEAKEEAGATYDDLRKKTRRTNDDA